MVKSFIHPCKDLPCQTCGSQSGDDCKASNGDVVTFHARRMRDWTKTHVTFQQKKALRRRPKIPILLSVFDDWKDAEAEVLIINDGGDFEWNPKHFMPAIVLNQETMKWEVYIGYRRFMKNYRWAQNNLPKRQT